MEKDGNKKHKSPLVSDEKVNKNKVDPHAVTKACLNCGKEFKTSTRRARMKRFCSYTCGYFYNNHKVKRCPHCGKVIPKTTHGGARHGLRKEKT